MFPVARARSPACEEASPLREFEADRLATNTGFRQTSPVLSRHDDTGGRRSGAPAARHEQEMGGAIHELLARGMRLLKALQFIGKLIIAWRRDGIPPGIWHESTVKEVEAAQI